MSDWPDNMDVGAIREWPGQLRAPSNRVNAKFKSPGRWEQGPNGQRWVGQKPMPLPRTLADLDRELRHLYAKNVELLVAIPAGSTYWRNDGKPRAGVRAEHPGVILSFEIPKLGRVSYPSDRYTRWEDNLRAIAVTLESLRLVERHGVVQHGDQYRGFLAIEARPAGVFTSDEAAMRFLMAAADMIVDPQLDVFAGYAKDERKAIARKALFKLHPDQGGDPAEFQKAMQAKTLLGGNGLL